MFSHQYLQYFILIIINLIVNGDAIRTKDKMYQDIDGSKPCYRRMNATHQTGCSSKRGGSTGVIHYCETQSDLDFIVKNGTAPPYIPIIPTAMFTSSNLNHLRGSKKISGLIVYIPESPPKYFSHENQCPNPLSSMKGTCGGEKLTWNPHGTGILYEDIPFPVFLVENRESLNQIRECFEKHNNHSYSTQRDRSLCSVQLVSFMHATTDTPTCIRRSNSMTNLNPAKFCDPLGDQNTWASLFPLKGGQDFTEPIKNATFIVVAARVDTTSMFEKTTGAISPITGMVTLITTAKILKAMNFTRNNKNVLFVLFNGETYDYIGSQRFVYDLMKENFPSKADSIKVDDIELFLELSQINKTGKLVAHYLNKPATFIKNLMDNVEGFEFKQSLSLPPGSVHSFMRVKADFPGVILADHQNSYANNFYNSIYDNGSNINYQYQNLTKDDVVYEDNIQSYIAKVSEVVAKALYQEITGAKFDKELTSEIQFVDELFHCYLEDADCRVHQAVKQKLKMGNTPLSLYVSVERGINFITTFAGLTLAWVTGEVSGESNINCTNKNKNESLQYYNFSQSLDDLNTTKCYRTSMNFTDAVSPAFIIDDYDWSSGLYSSWTESTWGDIYVRMFLKPSAAHENMTISIGCIAFIFSFLFVYFVKSRSDILFAPQLPTLAPTDC